jgi:hypothetical protein
MTDNEIDDLEGDDPLPWKPARKPTKKQIALALASMHRELDRLTAVMAAYDRGSARPPAAPTKGKRRHK